MAKKSTPRGWLALLLALVMVILTGCSGGKTPSSPAPTAATTPTAAPTEAPAATEVPEATQAPSFVEDETLILYIKESMLDVGGDGTLEITVLCGNGVKENIDVVDDTGAVLATIENTSGGQQYELTVEVSTQAERVGTLAARTATAESTPRKFYIYPEVTEEMVNRLDDAGENMLEYVTSCDFEDAYSDEAYQQIADWLNQQDYIDYAEINGDGVLFRTADGLMGGYGYQPTEGYLGSADDDSESESEAAPDYGIFADPERVFEDWLNGEDVSSEFLESQIPITNTNYLLWAGDYGDDTIHEIAQQVMQLYLPILGHATDGTITLSIDRDAEEDLKENVPEAQFENDAFERIRFGDITDYGFLVLAGHGRADMYLYDESPCFAMIAGECNSKNLAALGYSSLYSHDGKRVLAFKEYNTGIEKGNDEYTQAAKHIAAIVSGKYNIYITIDFFEQALRNKIFDNTIVFLESCQGMMDPNFYNLLLEHGASAVIGFDESIALSYGAVALYEIINSMVSTDTSNSYGTLSEGCDNFSSESLFSSEGDLNGLDEVFDDISNAEVTAGVVQYAETNRHVIMEYREAAPLHIEVRNMSPAQQEQAVIDDPYANRQFLGYGLVSGAVVDHFGDPLPEAEVKLYRWLNHDFVEHEVKVQGPVQGDEDLGALPIITNDLGEFTVKNVPYGLYVAYAEKDGLYDFTPFFVQWPGNEAVVQIENHPFIMNGTVTEGNTAAYSAQIIYPTFYMKGNDSLGNLQEAIRPIVQNAQASMMEMLQTPLVADRTHKVASGVTDIRVTGKYVSVEVSSYAEFSGSVHGIHDWQAFTYWLNTGEPVRLSEILDRDNPNAETRLKALWRNMLSRSGVTDGMLWRPITETVDAAISGELTLVWYFTEEGLHLQFLPYEAASYNMGTMEVVLPYEMLDGIIGENFLPAPPPDEDTVENEPVSASVMPIVFGPKYKHSFQQANELAKQEGEEPPHPVYGTEAIGAHLIAVDGYAENFRVFAAPSALSEPIVLFFASYIKDALVWLPDMEVDTFEAVWEADGVTRSVTLKF